MLELVPRFWDPGSYAFWYVGLAVCFLVAEWFLAWRPHKLPGRKQSSQDLLWWICNGLYAGSLLSWLILLTLPAFRHLPTPILHDLPRAWQFIVVLIAKDFFEWWVHRALHRVPWLWRIHRLHHSIRVMDWVGNMRFHPLEIAVYRLALWLPLGLIAVDLAVALALAIVSTTIGHLNHANLRWSWGPLDKILNGPAFHIWHHDHDCPRPHGCNYAIIFRFWDHLFGTAYTGSGHPQPLRLGFRGDETYPETWLSRLFHFRKSGADHG